MTRRINVAEIEVPGTDGDARLEMEFNVVYPREDASYCTYAASCGQVERPDNVVIKLPWQRQPLGHLVTRCPDHQRKASR